VYYKRAVAAGSWKYRISHVVAKGGSGWWCCVPFGAVLFRFFVAREGRSIKLLAALLVSTGCGSPASDF
jgi:hypothetical protein